MQATTFEPIRSTPAAIACMKHQAQQLIFTNAMVTSIFSRRPGQSLLTRRTLSKRLELACGIPILHSGPGYGPNLFHLQLPMGSELHQDPIAPELPVIGGLVLLHSRNGVTVGSTLDLWQLLAGPPSPSTRNFCLNHFLLFSPTFCSPGVSYTGIPVFWLCLLHAGPTRNLGKAARPARLERFVATNTSLSGQRLLAPSSFSCF